MIIDPPFIAAAVAATLVVAHCLRAGSSESRQRRRNTLRRPSGDQDVVWTPDSSGQLFSSEKQPQGRLKATKPARPRSTTRPPRDPDPQPLQTVSGES